MGQEKDEGWDMVYLENEKLKGLVFKRSEHEAGTQPHDHKVGNGRAVRQNVEQDKLP